MYNVKLRNDEQKDRKRWINLSKEERLNELKEDYEAALKNKRPNIAAKILREIELNENGAETMRVSNGILVNDKIFVAALSNRWKNHGKNKWYYFKNIPHFVENYVLKNHKTCKNSS